MKNNNKFHLVSVDMGYGHQRAAYPFLDSCEGCLITANNYLEASKEEKSIWEKDKKNYEIISRFKKIPVIGEAVFSFMDYFQKIESFYPRRDLSKNSLQQLYFFKKVKRGLGKNLITKLNKNPLPILTTFFSVVYSAEHYNYKGKVYCIICDADASRSWAPIIPEKSNTIYLAPNKRVKERLILYGVKKDNIYLTGFPLPKENIGNDQKILKEDLKRRLASLDPNFYYIKKYKKLIESYLCPQEEIKKNKEPFNLTFAVGGAGAQKEIGITIARRLKDKIKNKEVKLNLIAGSRRDVFDYFNKELKKLFLFKDNFVNVVYNPDKIEYFKEFNLILRDTDILWTKPSELSFYAGLGIPIIMSQTIGSQEDYNRRWLLGIGAGVDSKNPENVDEWLFDFIDSGWLAEAAMNGFLNAPQEGTYNIESIILDNKIKEIDETRIM
ncbi:MAG: hypothetical protein WC280_00895 [Patescibacteria group bacterium]